MQSEEEQQQQYIHKNQNESSAEQAQEDIINQCINIDEQNIQKQSNEINDKQENNIEQHVESSEKSIDNIISNNTNIINNNIEHNEIIEIANASKSNEQNNQINEMNDKDNQESNIDEQQVINDEQQIEKEVQQQLPQQQLLQSENNNIENIIKQDDQLEQNNEEQIDVEDIPIQSNSEQEQNYEEQIINHDKLQLNEENNLESKNENNNNLEQIYENNNQQEELQQEEQVNIINQFSDENYVQNIEHNHSNHYEEKQQSIDNFNEQKQSNNVDNLNINISNNDNNQISDIHHTSQEIIQSNQQQSQIIDIQEEDQNKVNQEQSIVDKNNQHQEDDNDFQINILNMNNNEDNYNQLNHEQQLEEIQKKQSQEQENNNSTNNEFPHLSQSFSNSPKEQDKQISPNNQHDLNINIKNINEQCLSQNISSQLMKEKKQRKLTEDTLEENTSFQLQQEFVISDDLSFIKPKTDTMISENQSVVIADEAMTQKLNHNNNNNNLIQIQTIVEVSTDQSSIEISQNHRSLQENKIFQSAIFERDSKQNSNIGYKQDRLCKTEISSYDEKDSKKQEEIDPNSFDGRRTRYRYIKCWEDKRVQIVGIFQNIVENMSDYGIGIGTSSSKSNYIIIKYFKDKRYQFQQFSDKSDHPIRNKGGSYFTSLNAILSELDDINARKMNNYKSFASFIDTQIILELLNSNAVKYESRLNRYKELANFTNLQIICMQINNPLKYNKNNNNNNKRKKIQKIGRGAAEEYQDYSNLFSDLASKELKTKNKKSLKSRFQKKDLCLNEWNFLSKVYEHYDCLKNFGIETLKFIKELKELELQRVEGIASALKLYVNKYEELISKISSNLLYSSIKSDLQNKLQQKNSSFTYVKQRSFKKSQENYQNTLMQTSLNKDQFYEQSPPQKNNRLNLSNPSFSSNSNDTKDIIEMQNLSIQEENYSPSNYFKRRSESPEDKKHRNSRTSHIASFQQQQNQPNQNQQQQYNQDNHSRLMREDQNKLNRSMIQQIEDCDIEQEIFPFFVLKNFIPFEEQYYLRKLYEISDDCEVSFDHLFKFIEQFQLKNVKTSELIRKEYKAQYIKSNTVRKDVLIIVTLDYNLIIVESLASNFFKKPICFIKGYRSKFSQQNNQIIVTEVNNILFRTKNYYTFKFDYSQDSLDFINFMKNK